MEEECKTSKPVEKTFLLSDMQKGLLLFSLASTKPGYMQQLICRLRYEVDFAAFQRAWQLVFNRHEALRTAFRWERLEEPVQDVYAEVPAVVQRFDFSNLSQQEQSKRVDEYLGHDRMQPFDFATPPLARLALFQLGQNDYVFLFTNTHAVLDGRARKVLMEEAFLVYDALCKGADAELPAAPQFSQFIAWLQQQDWTFTREYWRGLFAGDKPSLCANMPCKRQPDADRGPYKTVPIKLSTALNASLELLAKSNKLTLNTFVQGCWATVLHRYSGLKELTFGATRACRHIPVEGAPRIAGLLINTLPLRVRFVPQARLIDIFRTLRAQSIAIRPFECMPLSQVHEWSGMERGQQLFETIVIFEDNVAGHLPGLANCQHAPSEVRRFGDDHYPLTLFGYGNPSLHLEIVYDASQFDDTLIEQMAAHYSALLENLPATVDRHLADIPSLTNEEFEQIVMRWNQTDVQYPAGCMHELFEKQAARTPSAVAVEGAGRQLTFEELDRQSNQLARHLRKHGIGPEKLVGVCLDRTPELLIALLGILKTGGGYVPLDPNYPSHRMSFILNDTQATALLVQEKHLARISTPAIEILPAEHIWNVIREETPGHLDVDVSPENIAYVIYTSGSTGRPKGVMIEHRSAVAFLHWARDSFRAEDLAATLASTSICFDLSVFEIFAPLAWGGRVLLAENVLELQEVAKHSPVRFVNSVPSLVAELLRNGKMPSSVQTVNLAGEPLSTGLVNELYQQENVQRVFDLYGPSEDTTYSTWTLRSAEAPATIGRPIANEKLYVLDPDLQPVPVGVAAELYIGGQGLARGYLKRPELTAEKFVPDPFSGQAGARLYRTGDRVRYRRDGNLEYLGRTDHQVKVRGFRIELGEIQTALEQHPAIQQSAVMVVERGDGDKRLVAYVMFQAGNKPTRSELAAFLREKLPGYMVPSYFVPLERFPLNQNGKLDCQALPKPELSEETTYTPPRNTWERKIAQCWKEVLGIERIGVKETFFDLGGHSMLLPRLNTRLEQALNCSIPILVLFQHPTIESLARYFSGTTKMFGPDGATSRENLRQGIARLGRLLETSKTGQ